MEPHIYDLDRDEITDFEKFLKKPPSVVLFTFKDFEIRNLL